MEKKEDLVFLGKYFGTVTAGEGTTCVSWSGSSHSSRRLPVCNAEKGGEKRRVRDEAVEGRGQGRRL